MPTEQTQIKVLNGHFVTVKRPVGKDHLKTPKMIALILGTALMIVSIFLSQSYGQTRNLVTLIFLLPMLLTATGLLLFSVGRMTRIEVNEFIGGIPHRGEESHTMYRLASIVGTTRVVGDEAERLIPHIKTICQDYDPEELDQSLAYISQWCDKHDPH